MLGVLRAAEGYLAGRRVDAPRYSAELLLGAVLGLPRLQLYLAHDRPLAEAERAALRPLVARRATGVPLAYLLGEWDFRDLTLYVDEAVLVPRPETEGLVERAVAGLPGSAHCAEIGTGSGAIAVALASERDDVTVAASDVSAAALAVARRNVERHRLADRVRLYEGADWQPLTPHGPFDALISNPPYVDPERTDLLAPEVAAHEPAVALYTRPGEPASAYAALIAGAEHALRPGGWLWLETGVGAAEPALALLRAAPFLTDATLEYDAAGLPRYLSARRRS